MRNVVLSITATSLFLIGCNQLPKPPETWQCALISDSEFFCINSKTKEEKMIGTGDSSMAGAQCLSLFDYESMQDWISTVKEIAERKCRK